MAKKTILVTGVAGFIGAHVARKLFKNGYNVVGVDNFNQYYDINLKKDRVKYLIATDRIKIYRCNIINYAKLEKVFINHKIDIICHLAAQAGVRYSLENPFVYQESNIQGTMNLLELAKNYGIKKFIFASSSSVYGERASSPFKETDITEKPVSLYAATKKATELLAYSYHKNFGLNLIGLRFFTVYGPWGRPDMALFKFTKNIIKNISIEVYNYGKMKRDFTYIDDIVSGVLSSIKKNFSWEIINLCSSRPVNLMKVIAILEKEIGKKAKKHYLPLQKGDVLQTYGSSKKAKELLGFKPRVSIEEGIRNFVEWYRKYNRI